MVKVRIVAIGSQKISRQMMKNKPPMKSKKIGDITEFQKNWRFQQYRGNCLLNVITDNVISLIIQTTS
jgi:hypothetical protein